MEEAEKLKPEVEGLLNKFWFLFFGIYMAGHKLFKNSLITGLKPQNLQWLKQSGLKGRRAVWLQSVSFFNALCSSDDCQ